MQIVLPWMAEGVTLDLFHHCCGLEPLLVKAIVLSLYQPYTVEDLEANLYLIRTLWSHPLFQDFYKCWEALWPKLSADPAKLGSLSHW